MLWRIEERFAMNGLSATELEFDTSFVVIYQTCCGKVIIEFRDGRNIPRYIIDETNESY